MALKGRSRNGNKGKLFCVHGHALTPENVWVQKKTGKRQCRTCLRNRKRLWTKAWRATVAASVSVLLSIPAFAESQYIFLNDNHGPNVPSALVLPPAFPVQQPFAIGWGVPGLWLLQQWENPFPLTQFTPARCDDGTEWGLATPTARVCWERPAPPATSYSVEIAGNSNPLKCFNGQAPPPVGEPLPPTANELDLFVSNNAVDAPATAHWFSSPTLDRLVSLRLSLAVAYPFRLVGEKCGWPHDSVQIVIGIPLSTTDFQQGNYYQLVIATAFPPARGGDVCGSAPWWYFTGPRTFGVVDYEPGACLFPSGRRELSVDLLPHLIALTKAGPAGMIRDPAKWRVSGFYAGVILYGNALVVTRFDSLSLKGELK